MQLGLIAENSYCDLAQRRFVLSFITVDHGETGPELEALELLTT